MRVAIFVPAYEAERTLEDVIRRIPSPVYDSVGRILIQDDCSADGTYAVALRLASNREKLGVVRNEVNLGYGGTKKKAYRALIEEGFDIIVMLHGDGQHAPEDLSAILAPVLEGHADVVLGSRMLEGALRGGMPVYKYIGNRFLTFLLNRALHLQLTDYHTGYKAYSTRALIAIDFLSCSDGHEISSETLLRAANKGLRIAEVPVTTSYGPDSRSCSLVTSIKYGLNLMKQIQADRSRAR